MKKTLFLLILILGLTFISNSQTLNFIYSDTIKVNSQSEVLSNPWFGALQYPQFSNIDIDSDGDEDIFVFERYDGQVLIFENRNGNLKFNPHYHDLFPSFSSWVLLVDYNCDGKKDIFTSNAGNISVYQNISVDEKPQFELTTLKLRDKNGALIFIDFADIPSITDIDFDGDVDILKFDAGGTYVEFYKNLQVENSLDCSELQFEIETICWGDFSEAGLDNSITLGDNCGGGILPDDNGDLQSEKRAKHAGSSLLAFDYDNDRDMDLLLGDISSNNLVYLRNGKDSTDAIMDQVITSFPSGNPVDIYVFNAAYFFDADLDGDKDLVVAPNVNGDNAGKNFEQVWLYENSGSSSNITIALNKKNYLTSECVELGAGASPAFIDYDNDGDLDIISGNYAYSSDGSTNQNALMLLENIGSSTIPEYKIIDEDFGGTSSLGLFNTYPAFGDLDADGDQDMILGEQTGKFYYFRNTASPGSPMNLELDSSKYGGLDVGNNSAPVLYDIDGDKDLDLLSGESAGNINLFINEGDTITADFQAGSNYDSVGFIRILNPTWNIGYSTPKIYDITRDGNVDLICGSYDGTIFVYSDIINNLSKRIEPIQTQMYNPLQNSFNDINYGKRSAPAIADLNGDSLADIIMGLYRGGFVSLLNNPDSTLTIPEKGNFGTTPQIYPNPAHDYLLLSGLQSAIKYNLQIYNLQGSIIYEKTYDPTGIDISRLPKGFYIVIVKSEEKIVLKDKLIKR